MDVIIVSPSLDPTQNVSGVSAVTQFIIANNPQHQYIHFEQGRKDNEKGGFRRIFAVIKNFFFWIKTLNNNPNAIIHYNFPLSKQSVLRDTPFMMYARWKARKLIVHVHGGIFLTSSQIPFLYNIILKHIFACKLSFVVLSETEKNILHTRFNCNGKIYVLPNCVDLRVAANFKREDISNHRTLILGYLGRIAATKGMGELLDACKELKEKGVQYKLLLAGKEEVQDKYLPLFCQELRDNFEYCGVISGEAKNEFLKHLDIFVLPSYFEGLPMSLIECMAFGAVPITTPVGSIPEVITDGENGIFIKIKDCSSIKDAICDIDANRNKLKTLSQNAKQKIFNMFNPQEYIEKLNNIYNS